MFNTYNIYIRLPVRESVLGPTLQQMVGELRGKSDMPAGIDLSRKSPRKINYPLKRDEHGRMMKPKKEISNGPATI